MSGEIDRETIEEELIRLVKVVMEDEAMEIDPDRSLMSDYGLDSLDLLDFTFNIEERYGVAIGANELRGRARDELTDDEMFDEDGAISPRALEILKRSIPEIPPDKFVYGLRQEDIPTLLNIHVFTRLVYEKKQGGSHH